MSKSSQEKLDRIQKMTANVVAAIDDEFNLNDKELDIVIKGMWSGLNKVLDRRYKEVKNRLMIHPDREY